MSDDGLWEGDCMKADGLQQRGGERWVLVEQRL